MLPSFVFLIFLGLVFSYFTMYLDLLEEKLKLADFKYCRLDGSMSIEARRVR